jgi:predicted nucleic acid-binding Zn ribbon protein
MRRPLESYEITHCGDPFEVVAAGADTSGAVCALCNAKLTVEWIAGRAAIAAEVATA